MNYEIIIEEYAKCLEVHGQGVDGMFYGLALDGAIQRLSRSFPEIPQFKIVDDLIKARRLETAQNKETVYA